jgi:MFS family permease
MRSDVAGQPLEQQARPGRGDFAGVLANGAFLRLWLAQALSQTAQQTINFVLLIQVRQLIEAKGAGGANTALSLLILSFAIPPVLFSALAGVLVDRADKRAIMAGVNAARALCVAGYLLINPAWPLLATLFCIYALSFVFSGVGQFFGPAEGATIPLLARAEQLMAANALFTLTFIGSQLLGFVLLGPLLAALVALPYLYLGAVALFLLCATLCRSLPPTPAPARTAQAAARPTIRGDLREVWRFVVRDRLLTKAIVYLTIANAAFLMVAALGPEFLSTALGLPAERLALVVAPAGLGMLAGVAAVGQLGRLNDRERLIDRALVIAGLALLGFTLAPAVFVAGGDRTIGGPALLATMALAAGVGLANAFVIVPSNTLLQERSQDHLRARVLATFFTVSNAVALVPILFAGLLGDLFGVVGVLAGIALLILATGLLAGWRRHSGRRV